MKSIIFDTSTLILLAKTALLELLANHVVIVIPEAVRKEAVRKEELMDAKLILRLIQEKKVCVESKKQDQWIKITAKEFLLGEGEAEALALAKARGCVLGIDDRQGIKACKVLGISFTTALTIIERLYEKEFLSFEQAKAKIEKLKDYGWYDQDFLDKVLNHMKGGRENGRDESSLK